MFKKKVQDSVAIAKQIKIAERTLQKDKKKALYMLLVQTILMMGLLVVQGIGFSLYEPIGTIIMLLWIGFILVASIFGFNAIFYIDQNRLGPYKIANVVLHVVLVISFIVQQTTLKKDDYIQENKQLYDITLWLNIVLLGLAVVLKISLLVVLSGLKRKWNKTREKSELKSAVFNKESYESLLQASLVVNENNT